VLCVPFNALTLMVLVAGRTFAALENPVTLIPRGSLPVKAEEEKLRRNRLIWFTWKLYGPLSGTTRVSRYQKKHSPTHHPDHHPILYQLLPSTTIHSILLVQIKCLAIFLHNLFPCPLWSTSWSGALHLIFHTVLYAIKLTLTVATP